MRYHSLIRFLLILFLSGSFGLYAQSVFTVTSNADSGPGTLRAAFNNAAPNDTIRFAVTGRIELTSGTLSFNNSLVIEGPGAELLTVSGDSTYTVFTFNQSGPYNLDISDLTIQGGKPTGLWVNGYNRVRLNGVKFRRNYGVQSSRGGGASVWCTTAEMYNCTFVENLLTYTVGSTPTTEGAGAFVYANRLMMDSCRFEKNTGSASTGSPLSYGSGLYFFPTGSNQKIYISNTVFIENRAFASNGAGLGVGLAVRGTGVSNDGGLIQLENCEFDSNSVFTGYMSGVAIHIDAIDTVIIKGTSVHGHLNGGVGSFGAVFSRARKLMRIENSVFRNNQADNGAAVYMRSHIADSAEFEMDGCLFEGNIHYGGSSTGAIDVAATKNIKISRSRFINNTWTGLTLGPYRGGTEIRDCEFAECPRWDFEIVGIGSSGNPASIHLIENCSFSRTTGFSVHVRDMNSTPNFRHCTWADCYSYMYLHGANSRFTNCIFSYTTTPPTTPVFIFGGGNVLSGGGNISRGNGLSSYLGAGGDLHNTNPQLQALAFNGGPTRTFAIAGSSLAVNHGGTGSLITDQRGYIRDNQKDTGAFEYNAGNPNQVQVVSQSPSTSACTGDNLVLTLTVSGPGPISYQWTFNGSNLPGQNQVNLNLNSIQPAQAGNYTCVVNNGSNADTSSVIAVQVFALPTADAGADQTICAGQSATLTATGGTSYTWNQGLGAGATKTVSPASTTTYAVTVTNANNCSATDNVTVAVNALPTANAGTNQSICAGQSATLSASGGTSYTWNQGLGAGATQTVSPTTTTTYTVTVTNAGNCSATDDITVTVNAAPSANAGANQSICVGQSATLNASGGTSYTWNQGLGGGASHTVSPTSSTTYTVTVTNANNCTATDDITVTVNPIPSANAGSDQTICEGQSVTLNATGSGTYTWSQGLGAGATHSVSPTTSTTYTVTVTNANNCTATDDITVTVNPIPAANAGPDVAICAGQSANLGASGGSSYNWNQGLGAGASQTVSPTSTTTYTVTVTNANNCSATDAITVTVNALPTVSFSGLGSTYCTTDAVVSLVGSPSGGVFSGNGVSGQSFDPALAGVGIHSVQYDFTDGNGCSANSSISTQVSVCTGIASGHIGENPFEVYPNPFQTTLNVRFLSQALSGWSVHVVDLHGKALHIGTTEEADLLRMDFSRLRAGIYFLLIEGDGQRYQEKVVKVGN